jgi:putative CocE/NonD family hydrolase
VPTRGGALLLTADHPAGPADQRPVDARDDVLVHTSAVLTRPLEVAGRVRAVLAVVSTASATTWVARLCDVAPDGTSRNLTDGNLRGTATGRAELTVDLWSTAYVFQPGHAIRLHVAATSHPRWQPEPQPADQTVWPGISRLLLPCVT